MYGALFSKAAPGDPLKLSSKKTGLAVKVDLLGPALSILNHRYSYGNSGLNLRGIKYIRYPTQDPYAYAPNAYGVYTSIKQATGLNFINGIQFSSTGGFPFDFLASIGFFAAVSKTFSASPSSFSYPYGVTYSQQEFYSRYLAVPGITYPPALDFRLTLNLGYRF